MVQSRFRCCFDGFTAAYQAVTCANRFKIYIFPILSFTLTFIPVPWIGGGFYWLRECNKSFTPERNKLANYRRDTAETFNKEVIRYHTLTVTVKLLWHLAFALAQDREQHEVWEPKNLCTWPWICWIIYDISHSSPTHTKTEKWWPFSAVEHQISC